MQNGKYERKKKNDDVLKMLQSKGYEVIDDNGYNYLTKMPMDSVTEENVESLFKELGDNQITLDKIKTTTINQMWSSELDSLKTAYLEYKEERERLMLGEEKEKKKVTKKIVKKAKVIVEE